MLTDRSQRISLNSNLVFIYENVATSMFKVCAAMCLTMVPPPCPYFKNIKIDCIWPGRFYGPSLMSVEMLYRKETEIRDCIYEKWSSD